MTSLSNSNVFLPVVLYMTNTAQLEKVSYTALYESQSLIMYWESTPWLNTITKTLTAVEAYLNLKKVNTFKSK